MVRRFYVARFDGLQEGLCKRRLRDFFKRFAKEVFLQK